MLTCREALEFLSDYLTGELPPEVRTAFDEHLAECPDCRRYLFAYEQTILLGKMAFDGTADDAAAELPEELVVAILTARCHNERN